MKKNKNYLLFILCLFSGKMFAGGLKGDFNYSDILQHPLLHPVFIIFFLFISAPSIICSIVYYSERKRSMLITSIILMVIFDILLLFYFGIEFLNANDEINTYRDRIDFWVTLFFLTIMVILILLKIILLAKKRE